MVNKSLVEILPSVKVVPCTDVATLNNREIEIPDKVTLQAVGGDVKVTLCPQGGKILGRMANILAHQMVASEVITGQAPRIATAVELSHVKVGGHSTSITGVRIPGTLMIVASHTILGVDNQDRINPEVVIKGRIRLRVAFKGHSLPIKEQGHTINLANKSPNHIIPQGMIAHMQSLHRHNRNLGVVVCAASNAATQTSTTVSDGMLTKVVADVAVTPSSMECKVKVPKDRLPSSLHLNRETGSGDRDRATGPHHHHIIIIINQRFIVRLLLGKIRT